MADKRKPLPCPWCGAVPRIYGDGDVVGYGVECVNMECDVMPATPEISSELEDAVAAWNRRAPLTGESSHG